jgi:hypothetical protein
MFLRRIIQCAALVVSFSACAAPQGPGPSPRHGFDTFGQGLGQLMVSPFLIAAGLLEGIASLPHFLATDLHELNRNMVAGGARVDVGRTWRYAYEQDLEQVPTGGEAGVRFRHMAQASSYFQRVLKGYGVADHSSYYLTALRTADREGYTLYAVVHRPAASIRVRDAAGRISHLGRSDRAFYRPYEQDLQGRPLDVVIDWAGVPRSSVMTQRGQAILMTIAANSVLTNRRSDDYWSAQARWSNGGHREIVAERDLYLKRRMAL